MSEFFEGYYVLPSDVELTPERIYQPNGETKTVATKVPVYEDVVDEDGEPTGEQKFSHYELDHDNTVEIDLYTGGWATSADNGDMIAIVISTAPVLDDLAAEDGAVEVERMPKDGAVDGEVVEVEPEPQRKGRGNDKPDNPNKPTDEEKAAKKAAKNKKLKDKGMQEIPEDIEEPEDTINFVFQQVDPGYKYGKGKLG